MKKLFSVLSVALFVGVLSSSTVAAPELNVEPWIIDLETLEIIDDGDTEGIWVCPGGDLGCTYVAFPKKGN